MDIFLHNANEIYNSYDEGYALMSADNEIVFGIDCNYNDEGLISSYTAYNSMGFGQWHCSTVEECIKVIEAAYNDTVIDKR